MRRLACLLWMALVPLGAAGQAEEAAEPASPSSAGRAAEPARTASPSSAGRAADRLGLQIGSDQPMTIESDELEAAPDDTGRDRVIFEHNVSVHQGDMVLHCDWLEALYPRQQAGSGTGGRPERITARGQVRIVQGESEARCSEAVFNDQACSAECVTAGGKATLTRGADVIEADRILFDLCKGIFKARGGVRIRTRSDARGTSE